MIPAKVTSVDRSRQDSPYPNTKKIPHPDQVVKI